MNNAKLIENVSRVILNDERLKLAGFKTIYISTPPLSDDSFDLFWSFEKEDVRHTFAFEFYQHTSERQLPKYLVSQLVNSIRNSDREITGGAIVFNGQLSCDVKVLAKKHSILLIPIGPTQKDDWAGRIKDIHINMTMVVPSVTDFKLGFNKVDAKRVLEQAGKDSLTMNFSVNPRDVSLYDENGRILSSLSDIIDTHLKKANEEGIHPVEHSFDIPTFLKTEIGNIMLDSIGFKITIDNIKNPFTISGEREDFQIAFSITRFFLKLVVIPNLQCSS